MIRGQRSIAQICSGFGIHPTQARIWKEKAIEGLGVIFTDGVKSELVKKDELIDELYTEIGRAKTELDWLKKKMGMSTQ